MLGRCAVGESRAEGIRLWLMTSRDLNRDESARMVDTPDAMMDQLFCGYARWNQQVQESWKHD